MPTKKFSHLILALSFMVISSQIPLSYAEATTPTYEQQLSANIPLNSHVYDDLEKLDGLGYLRSMRIGAKPYTRMQAAKFIKEAIDLTNRDGVPQYVKTMVSELQNEFRKELSTLTDGNSANHTFGLSEWTAGFAYYDGPTLNQQRTASTFQPFATYSDGYRFGQNDNYTLSARLEGKLDKHFVLSVTPRIGSKADKHATLQSAYAKTHINNMEIQLGKDSLWWGQGKRGSLLLTNNSEPKAALKLSTIEPLQTGGIFTFLGQVHAAGFYSELEDTRNDVNSPSFTGIRFDFVPSENFTFGAARADIVGGKGHSLSGDDYLDWLLGVNASSARIDQWNTIAGLDFRWRMPHLNGIQLYGELYGEDQAGHIIPMPSQNAYLIGVYFPRISDSGNWDAHFEYAHTTNVWYDHSLYTSGYVYKGNLIGDAMGNDAHRYYARATHHTNSASQIGLHTEQVVMSQSAPQPQKINSVWISLRSKLGNDLFMDASAGKAWITNQGFQTAEKGNTTFTSLQLSQRF